MNRFVSVFALGALFVATAAFAADKKITYEFSPDGRTVRVTNPPAAVPDTSNDTSLRRIAGNFSTYPLARYFSIWGNTIAQGGSNFPFQAWMGIAFTPASDASVTKIQVSAGHQGSGTTGFEVGLWDDDNGVPGKPLKSIHVKQLPNYGECCKVATAMIPNGVSVKGGTRYWVVVSTTANDTDIYAWAYNSTDMSAQKAAFWCKGDSTFCGTNSGVWQPFDYVQNGFAVWGQ